MRILSFPDPSESSPEDSIGALRSAVEAFLSAMGVRPLRIVLTIAARGFPAPITLPFISDSATDQGSRSDAMDGQDDPEKRMKPSARAVLQCLLASPVPLLGKNIMTHAMVGRTAVMAALAELRRRGLAGHNSDGYFAIKGLPANAQEATQ